MIQSPHRRQPMIITMTCSKMMKMRKKEPNKTNDLEYEGDLFYPSYCYAKCKPMQCLFDDEKDYESEYWITCGLNSNIKESDFQRNTLNLVIVLDISGSMSSTFSG